MGQSQALPDEQQAIVAFGFQERFCFDGMSAEPELAEWEDYLYLLAHGGRGSGKSKGGAIRTVRYMLTWPRCFGIVTAPTRDMLRTSTLPAVVSVLETWGLFEGRDWTYNKTESILTLPAVGSRAFFASTEEPEHLRGQDTSFCWPDEPRDSPFVAFLNLQATLRQPGYPHQMWLTTTPVGRRHWLHAVFYPDKTDPEFLEELHLSGGWSGGDRDIRRTTILPSGRTVESHYVAYPARTLDNPHGGEEHYAQLVSTYGEGSLLARQELDGEFVLMEGLTYPNWNPDYHVVPPEKWPVRRPSRVIVTADFGSTNPFALLAEGIDGDGRRYILDEHYQRGLDPVTSLPIVRDFLNKWRPPWMYGDPEDRGWIQVWKNAGIPIFRAKKTVGTTANIASGIGLCSRALNRRIGPKEAQGFFVDPRCRHFITEIENYVRLEPKENRNPSEHPRLMGDHLMDCWRYAEIAIVQKLWWDKVEVRSRMPQQGRILTSMIGAR